MLTFEQTSLWKRTLASREHDPHAEERERLRAALLSMRSRAEELVKLIPLDCKGLTVHDVSHLDALWEMADLIAGDQYELNPSEAFVFGAAVLLHDAGMTVAAYPGGTSDLAQTTEWRDIAHTILQKDGIEPSFELIANPPPEKLPEITFLVLRAIHARAAEQLVNAQWPLPGTSDSVRLLEDLQLRTAFGSSIGRIAHSHNWDIARLSQSLRISVGAASGTPPQWTINELALACLLRCADAAHMDNTRAPSMALALTRPKGVSLEHWKFQNKLNKPTMSSGALIYSSGQDFDLKDAQAWWLCFDTIKMLNRELQSSNALLEDSGLRSFQARRVYGAESPAILARQVIANGWKPVDAEIRVSDPIHLAKTLGGANLYSDTVLDPIRELLQNAVDAVHARRKIQGRSQDWGRVKLAIESQSDQLWVHVDDNGIGMSEKTLVGPLLDFGRSFWASPEVRQEWPGLESAGLHPIGKFGIGFFSIFLLGDNVRVVSKRYDAGEAEARVLEFATIDQRPLVRAAKKGELLPDYNTRVSVRIDETRINPSAEGAVPIRKRLMGLLPSLQTLLCGVDVEITIETPADKCVHAANWTTIDAEKFLNEFLARVPNQERMRLIIGHAALLTVIEDPDGRV